LEDLNKKKSNFYSKKILLTIDDADIGIINILPIIKMYSIPIIFFIPVGFVLKNDDINYYRSICLHHYFFIRINNSSKLTKRKFFSKIMKYDIVKLKKLIDILKSKNFNQDYVIKRKKINYNLIKNFNNYNNIIIGSHSMSHVNLKYLPHNWLNWEINTSLNYIKKFNGNKNIFSLPYGNKNSYSKEVIKLLKDNNIRYIFTTQNIINEYDDILMGRFFILNSKNKFYLKGEQNGGQYLFNKIFLRN
jgi:peptidoglycan/xylan/chitin deacetylase (PgdA/CDA1 family)